MVCVKARGAGVRFRDLKPATLGCLRPSSSCSAALFPPPSATLRPKRRAGWRFESLAVSSHASPAWLSTQIAVLRIRGLYLHKQRVADPQEHFLCSLDAPGLSGLESNIFWFRAFCCLSSSSGAQQPLPKFAHKAFVDFEQIEQVITLMEGAWGWAQGRQPVEMSPNEMGTTSWVWIPSLLPWLEMSQMPQLGRAGPEEQHTVFCGAGIAGTNQDSAAIPLILLTGTGSHG